MPEQSVTSALASFITSISVDRLPDTVVRGAEEAILDTVAVLVAGTGTEVGRAALSIVSRLPQSGGSASIIGSVTGPRHSVHHALLVHGTLAHAMDFDDTSYGADAHLSAAIVPTLLTVGQREGASGPDLVEAYVAGFETASRLGRVLEEKYTIEKGPWHRTAVLGYLAAAAAAAKLCGIDAERTAMALGIASSQAAGLRSNIGSMTNPLHVGLAVQGGVQAVDLAAEGWLSASDALGAPWGFIEAFAPGADARGALSGLGEVFHLEQFGNAVKLYPACAAVSRPADAALELAHSASLTAEQVGHVRCGVDEVAYGYATFARPQTPEEARFSIQYAIAAAISGGSLGIPDYTAGAIRRLSTSDLLSRVDVYLHPELKHIDDWESRRFAQLDVHLRDGSIRSTRVHHPKGHPLNRLSRAESRAKFFTCVDGLLRFDVAETVYRACTDLVAWEGPPLAEIIASGGIPAPAAS